MMILSQQQILSRFCAPQAIQKIQEGFVAYSQHTTTTPLPSSLLFQDPPGDCHIKYGYMEHNPYFVVKIATGFPQNPVRGLPSGNGMMLLFSKETGAPVALFEDQGCLTDLRTACAGAIAATYLAPTPLDCIGMVGTGAQSVYQLELLKHATPCRRVCVWGRDRIKAERVATHPKLTHTYQIEVVHNLEELCRRCRLIVTTTSAKTPLLFADHIHPGTHITAVGADDQGKQELDAQLFAKADRIVVDSIAQCAVFGDTSYALAQGLITREDLVELGDVIRMRTFHKRDPQHITIADLTGIAIQDLQIACAILDNSDKMRKHL